MSEELVCRVCYKKLSDCECNEESMIGNKGYISSANFGDVSIDFSFVKMDDKIVMKMKLLNDYIYLDYNSMVSIRGSINEFMELQNTLKNKRLMDWDCNWCSKKTNNMQEYCDDCISKGRDEVCDC